jgi:thiol-disulfide isomerase/thioredoxin
MSKTPSSMLALGTQAPEFSLIDVVSGKNVLLNTKHQYLGTVIMFICNHCPYVKYVNPEIISLANDYLSQNIRFLAINSNDVTQYPDDSPQNMKQISQKLGYPFPYLFDETQEVAIAYQAKCTPDFFVFNKSLKLVYRGQLDDSRLNNELPLNGQAIRTALDYLMMDIDVPDHDQKPSVGCNIKWKSEKMQHLLL